jgi:hypothetical protein
VCGPRLSRGKQWRILGLVAHTIPSLQWKRLKEKLQFQVKAGLWTSLKEVSLRKRERIKDRRALRAADATAAIGAAALW